MNRRNFLAMGGQALALGALGASSLAKAFQGELPGHRYQVGISSDITTASLDWNDGQQHMSQWCWAACIEMVFGYYGYRVPQEEIVRQTWGSIVNLPGQPMQILADLNRPWIDANDEMFSVIGDAWSANALTAVRDLTDDMPLIIGTMGHAMVLTSLTYTTDAWGNPYFTEAIVEDPWPGKGRRLLSPTEWQHANFLVRIRVS